MPCSFEAGANKPRAVPVFEAQPTGNCDERQHPTTDAIRSGHPDHPLAYSSIDHGDLYRRLDRACGACGRMVRTGDAAAPLAWSERRGADPVPARLALADA